MILSYILLNFYNRKKKSLNSCKMISFNLTKFYYKLSSEANTSKLLPPIISPVVQSI